jgi:hypothetical protein
MHCNNKIATWTWLGIGSWCSSSSSSSYEGKRREEKENEKKLTEQSMKRREGDRVKREAAEYLICLCLAVCVTTYKRFLLHPTIHNQGMNMGQSHLIAQSHLLVGWNSFPEQCSHQQEQQQN